MNIDGGQEVIWEPLAPQEMALTCPARELLFGGEKGGGKSDYLVACWIPMLKMAHDKWVTTGQLQHRCRIIVFRKNTEDLKDLIVKSKDLYPRLDPAMGEEGWHVNDKTWTFSSGATIVFRHLDGPDDHRGYNGNEFVGMGFDEVQFIAYDAYKFLTWQVRSKDPDYHAARIIRCTANPGGEDWIIPHFGIDQCDEGGKVIEFTVKDPKTQEIHRVTRAFVRSRLDDNHHLASDYRAQMAANMNEDEISMYLEGDFKRVAGAYFSKFIRPTLHFQPSRPVPSSWEFRFAMDWGSSEPAALYVGAVDNDGCLWVIDELHMPGETGRVFGERMSKMWAGQAWCADRKFANDDFYGVIDKQAMDRTGGEGTAAAGIQQWGFRLWAANKDRANGCVQMKERFTLTAQGRPRCIIFEDRCPKLVRALSAIKSNAPKDPESYQERTSHSHACDGFRFLCMEFPVQSPRMTNKQDEEVARWEHMLAKVRQGSGDKPTMTGGYDG